MLVPLAPHVLLLHAAVASRSFLSRRVQDAWHSLPGSRRRHLMQFVTPPTGGNRFGSLLPPALSRLVTKIPYAAASPAQHAEVTGDMLLAFTINSNCIPQQAQYAKRHYSTACSP